MRRPAAGHIQPWVYHQRSRNRTHTPPFLRAGHIIRLPLGGAAFPRLPQRPCHGRAVVRRHGVGAAYPLRAAVYRFFHRRRKERIHKGIPAPHHRAAVYRGQGRSLRHIRRAGAGAWDFHRLRLCRAAVFAHGGLPQARRKRAELLRQPHGDGAHVLRLGGLLVARGADLRRPHKQQVYGLRFALRAFLSAHHPV